MRIKNSNVLPRVLSTLKNTAIAFTFVDASTSRGIYRAFKTFDELQSLSDRQLQSTVRHALRGNYIVITGSGSSRRIELTKKGKRVTQRMALESIRPARLKNWDKKWRIVLFDIPESSRKSRNSFAVGLKRMGFVQIQKSCFAFPYPCLEEVEVLADFCEVRPHVKLILAEQMDGGQVLFNKFKTQEK